MDSYKDFYNEFIKQTGFLTEQEFNDVIASLPNCEFDLDEMPIFIGTVYDQDYIGSELVYNKLLNEDDLDNDNMYVVSADLNFKDKTIEITYDVNGDVKVPEDKIRAIFPNYTITFYTYDVNDE